MRRLVGITLMLSVGWASVHAVAADLMPAMPEMRPAGVPATPQFTFRVPVRLSAIMPDTRAFIHCRPLHGMVVQAELQQEVPLDASGNFSGTVVVAGNLPAGKDPWQVDRYSCELRMQGAGASFPQTPCFGESCPAWWRSRPGTTFRPAVEAPMP
jgi:hypothetical protein